MNPAPACTDCLRRAWLLGEVAGHLEHHRAQIAEILTIPDAELIAAVGGNRRAELHRRHGAFTGVEAGALREAAQGRGLEVICRHGRSGPPSLEVLGAAAPAALFLAGAPGRLSELTARTAVAVVGTRRPTPAGLEMARELGRALSGAGVTVISGMALGIDSGAHEGALEAGGHTIAVLPGAADRAYPARRTRLYGRIRDAGAVLSELPPGLSPWRWSMLARNRIIAGLAQLTIVVEAAARSGALTTVRHARELGRPTAGVPGPVGARLAAGTNLVIAKHGAALVRGPQDVLDLLFGEGIVEVPATRLPELTDAEAAALKRICEGASTVNALGVEALGPLAGLELKGWVRRGPGGRLTPRMP